MNYLTQTVANLWNRQILILSKCCTYFVELIKRVWVFNIEKKTCQQQYNCKIIDWTSLKKNWINIFWLMKVFRNKYCLLKKDENIFSIEFFHVCNYESFLTFVIWTFKVIDISLFFSIFQMMQMMQMLLITVHE